jgi:HAD superfamily phosphatase (TIGR01668 family)
MEQWLLDMKQTDIQLCVVSNSKKDRVKVFCANYGIPCITHANKPFTKGIRECLTKFDIPASEAAIVGDQIYTDTLGGNLAGITPILLDRDNEYPDAEYLRIRSLNELLN